MITNGKRIPTVNGYLIPVSLLVLAAGLKLYARFRRSVPRPEAAP